MKIHQRHAWDLTPKEAMALQSGLAAEIVCRDDFGPVARVAGVDVGFEGNGATTRAAVAVLTFPSLQLETSAIARLPTRFPYVPGLLSFREIPAVLAAVERLNVRPDLLLCDGQGIAHPRLIGKHEVVPDARGAWVPLKAGSETIGAVLRTRRGVKPLYVSPGHRIGLESSIAWVMACLTRYRLPETTRWAHRLASEKPEKPL